MKKLFLHFSIFLFLFILINFIAAFFWKPFKNIILSNIFKKDYYSEDVLDAIKINPEEQYTFYQEMWVERKFKYVQFAEHLEAATDDNKYVNISDEYGRKVENNQNCTKRIFFYGSSVVFGYHLTDQQTLPSKFKKLISNDYCVFNFGSANYFSTQENILFINHILNEKFKKGDYAIFVNGLNENGNQTSRIHKQLKILFEGIDLKVWDELKFSSLAFINSLPVIKFFKSMNRKFTVRKDQKENNEEPKVDKEKLREIEQVFISNLKMRNSICETMSINCYTFLPPIRTDSEKIKIEQYELFKQLPYIIDISKLFTENDFLAYIDDVHYSPKSIEIVADAILTETNLN